VWDVETLKCLSTLTGHSGAVRALAASSKRVFSGSDDTTIKVGAIVGIEHLFQIIMPVFVQLQEV
jgi:WD40 repeat protein